MSRAPFIYGKLPESINFTNREAEKALLVRNFISGINTILISPRRWGKSSLVDSVRTHPELKKHKIITCQFDLYRISTEAEFYKELTRSVLAASGNRLEEMARLAGKFLGALLPRISINPDPLSEVAVSLEWSEENKDPGDVLDFAEKIAHEKKIRMVICIDEFQHIASFPDPEGFLKKLRAAWQRHKHVSYCIYGSKRHMLSEFFSNPHFPFYKFGEILLLQKIKRADWIPFIVKRFKDTGKRISAKDAGLIADLTANHPYYTQQLAQQSWHRTQDLCTEQEIYEAHEGIALQLSLLFSVQSDGLSYIQLNLLKALIAGESQFSSRETIEKYQLRTSAHIAKARQALIEKEILDDFNQKLEFLDPYFEYWLRHMYFKIG
jgi:uncharacterized protein